MTLERFEIEEEKIGKELYDYQREAIDKIFERLQNYPQGHNLLFQLPTGGGKTVIFSEITRRYMADLKKKVLILTHRIELCVQTSNMLLEFGVKNKIINSKVKSLPDQDEYDCFVAMVETLNNRLQNDKLELLDIGLVIIDEAHYNSFRKLFQHFEHANILGVTATPLSSNIRLPMKENYKELIVGHSISELIEKGFLSQAVTYSYDVHLGSLKIGADGDYTVSSSERLYNDYLMQKKLIGAYKENCIGKKTLIFNNGISTSKHVYTLFKEAGYTIEHLDNTHSDTERKAILDWFRTTPNAILSSVGILTTGFDEPTIDVIILNRATKSLTLYHQMIGRGSRKLPNKSEFTVIDLGNNAMRFGLWHAHVNWHDIFISPDFYIQNITPDTEIERHFKYTMPAELRAKFSLSTNLDFDIKEEYFELTKLGNRPIIAIEKSIEQHATICFENSTGFDSALWLAKLLEEEIDYRVKSYSHCICKSTDNYVSWLQEEYKRKLSLAINKKFISSEQEQEL